MRGIVLTTALVVAATAAAAWLPACFFDRSGPSMAEDDAGPTSDADAGPAVCGDGVVDLGEECDGADLGGATCTSVPGGYTGGTLACGASCHYDTTACVLPGCGNGEVGLGEECDDGNDSNTDACLNNCTVAACGDGFVWAGIEDCDDGNAQNTDACLNDCTVAACGDGYIWISQEACDDGNSSNGDGCSSACAVEDYSACDGQPSVCTCVVYVNWASTSPSIPAGSSWLNAYASFRDGINHAGTLAANAGDHCAVWAAGGTYFTSTAYSLPTRVHVYGGFAGGETALYQRNIGGNVTILDGLDSADSVIVGVNIADAGLNGVVVTHGSGAGDGGAVWLLGLDLTLANCVFGGNYADDDGGGVYITTDSTVTVKRCVFRNNIANHNAAGIAVRYGAQVVVQDSLFYSNAANGEGGAGWVDGTSTTTSSLTLINCTIVSNTGTNGGGAFRNDAGVLTVVGSILWNNGASEIDANGGTTNVTYSNIQGGFTGIGNLMTNPLFVSIGADNYQLQATSPCIDSADGNQASAWDLLGNARIDASPANTGTGIPAYVDRGAFEYQTP